MSNLISLNQLLNRLNREAALTGSGTLISCHHHIHKLLRGTKELEEVIHTMTREINELREDNKNLKFDKGVLEQALFPNINFIKGDNDENT